MYWTWKSQILELQGSHVMSVMYSTCLPPWIITQPVHALLHLSVCMSVCKHERVPSWHVWVIWYAHTRVCVCVCAQLIIILCQTCPTANPSVIFLVTSDDQAPPVNDRALQPLPPTKWGRLFITAWWQARGENASPQRGRKTARVIQGQRVNGWMGQNGKTAIKSEEKKSEKGSDRWSQWNKRKVLSSPPSVDGFRLSAEAPDGYLSRDWNLHARHGLAPPIGKYPDVLSTCLEW